ncbi:MAG: phage antirepressor protein, partial [Clostridia bacterium]|nr:phage antirepressor protein [Clostridia bacterium]
MQNKIKVFENKQVRTIWDAEKEDWYFSVVDIVAVLTDKDYDGARKYWKVLKGRLKTEGSELVSFCYQLKMQSSDGKYYKTDCLDTKGVLRLVQSIPSPKAEPFKMWLAEVGKERIEETLDPELIAERLAATYERKGYTREWINQRLMAISARKELTDEWKDRGVTQNKEYAILTDEITKAWSGMSTRQYKNLKGLKKESLRDNMSTTELVLNMLAETATRELSEAEKPDGLNQNISVAKKGGKIAGDARKAIEKETGKPVITNKTAGQLNHTVVQMIE